MARLIHTAEESKRDRKPVRYLMLRLILGMVSFPTHSIDHSKSLGQPRFKARELDPILDEKNSISTIQISCGQRGHSWAIDATNLTHH